MSILEKINSSADIKALDSFELRKLADELREFEIQSIAKTGGHLASNLGTVELTLALHRVYDTEKDRLVFDVGHQSYTHKIITGRRDSFSTLRQHGGLSGFPKPYERVDDAFIAGHASNSVSVALGMARARSYLKEDYDVVALIGDGALTGGLAYEGLADAAASNEPLVIILNDNNMSISENVGGMARLLQSLRIKPGYINFKKWFRSVSKHTRVVYDVVHRFKEWLKARILPSNVFSELGLYYLGPVDGHNLEQLENAIRLARDLDKPVILHVITKKGKGCPYAEAHPDKYHGVGSFDPASGELLSSGVSFSDKAGEYLCQYAETDDRLTVITAAMSGGTGTECFGAKYPERFYDIGIAEGHAVAMAAGMAKQGLLPVFAVYSSFLQRSFDMLIHDVSLLGLHVVCMTVLCPASFQELKDMMGYALHSVSGPVAIRYPRGGEGHYRDSSMSSETILREGSDLTIACYGTMVNEVLDAAELLEAKGISAEIVKIGVAFPNSYELCRRSAQKTGALLVAEEVCAAGCVGSAIITAAASSQEPLPRCRLLNLGEGIVPHGTVAQLRHDTGLDAESIAAKAVELVGRGSVKE